MTLRPARSVDVEHGCRGGVVEREFGCGTGGDRLAVPAETPDACRCGRHDARDIRPPHQAGLDDRRVHDGEGGLEPDHAVGRGLPFALLRLDRVRGVVGRDDVDRAVGECRAQRERVLAAAERRVDLEVRVVAR